MLTLLRSLVARLRGNRPRLSPYRVERAAETPVAAGELVTAILGAGFRVDERWRALVTSRAHGRDRAIVRLPRSRVLVAGPIQIRASERDLVLGLMTAMSSVLGALRVHTPELGEVVVNPPSGAASPDVQRAFTDPRRRRVASHYALDDARGPRRR